LIRRRETPVFEEGAIVAVFNVRDYWNFVSDIFYIIFLSEMESNVVTTRNK
jgi:hypothetical protein